MDYMLPCLLEQRILNVRCNRLLVTWDHHCENQLVFMDSAMLAGSIRSEALLGVPFYRCPRRVSVCVCSDSLCPDCHTCHVSLSTLCRVCI